MSRDQRPTVSARAAMRTAASPLRCCVQPVYRPAPGAGLAHTSGPGFEDHWVAEYWNAAESRWQMVDAQLDDVWLPMLKLIDDPFYVTPQQFVTAGHAWQAWRRGEMDEGRCRLSAVNEHGAHWIAGNLRLDLASLNKVEMCRGMCGEKGGSRAPHPMRRNCSCSTKWRR